MALDCLSVQASAVPCERVFSSSAETDTNKHNNIHPTLMEALQMMKFSLKLQRNSVDVDFLGGWCTSAESLQQEKLTDNDVLSRWFGASEESQDYESQMDDILKDVGPGF